MRYGDHNVRQQRRYQINAGRHSRETMYAVGMQREIRFTNLGPAPRRGYTVPSIFILLFFGSWLGQETFSPALYISLGLSFPSSSQEKLYTHIERG